MALKVIHLFIIAIVSDISLNLTKMMNQKEKAVKGLTSGIDLLFKKNKVDSIKGIGQIKSNFEVEIKETKQVIQAKNIVIATGSTHTNVPFAKIDEKTILSSTGAISLNKIPRKLAVIGGGIIGLELVLCNALIRVPYGVNLDPK